MVYTRTRIAVTDVLTLIFGGFEFYLQIQYFTDRRHAVIDAEVGAFDRSGGIKSAGRLLAEGMVGAIHRGHRKVTGLLTPRIVRSPVIVAGLSPFQVTPVDLKVMVGFSTAFKKSGERR